MTGNINKLTLTALLLASCSSSYAALIADGNYRLVINPTPTYEENGITKQDYGTQATGWNSSFTLGGIPLAGDSDGMSDNGVTVNHAIAGVVGTSIAGDGYAGVLGMSVSNGNIGINSFAVDAVLNTAGGSFVQSTGSNTNMYGSVDDFGNMTLTLEGRLGTIGNFEALYNKLWNYEDDPLSLRNGEIPAWTPFTTGTLQATGNNFGGPAPITGLPVVNIGDVNGDLIDDYSLILVSAGNIGADWEGFKNTPYAEVWNAQILSSVPVPAAVWLFASGLLGLIGVARRKR